MNNVGGLDNTQLQKYRLELRVRQRNVGAKF